MTERNNDFVYQSTLNKLRMLYKLDELQKSGVTISTKYTIESDYNVMRAEYDFHKYMKEKKGIVDDMYTSLILLVNGLETISAGWESPLTGLSTMLCNNNVKIKDLLNEIYEKYYKLGVQRPSQPELKLLIAIFADAVQSYYTNSLMKHCNFDDCAESNQLSENKKTKKFPSFQCCMDDCMTSETQSEFSVHDDIGEPRIHVNSPADKSGGRSRMSSMSSLDDEKLKTASSKKSDLFNSSILKKIMKKFPEITSLFNDNKSDFSQELNTERNMSVDGYSSEESLE